MDGLVRGLNVPSNCMRATIPVQLITLNADTIKVMCTAKNKILVLRKNEQLVLIKMFLKLNVFLSRRQDNFS